MSLVPQDKSILKSPIKVKKYLTDEGINYEAETPPFVLRGKAKARMKRKLNESISPAAKRSMFANSSAKTVTEIKELIARMKDGAMTGKKFERIRFTFEDLPTQFVSYKHATLDRSCNGLVVDNVCSKCQAKDVGVWTYGFKAVIGEIENEDNTMQVWCATGAGRTMFDTEAIAVKDWTTNMMSDAVEKMSCVPMGAGIIITYDADDDDLFVALYDVAPIDV